MYNPVEPNVYSEVKYNMYAAARKAAEEQQKQQQPQAVDAHTWASTADTTATTTPSLSSSLLLHAGNAASGVRSHGHRYGDDDGDKSDTSGATIRHASVLAAATAADGVDGDGDDGSRGRASMRQPPLVSHVQTISNVAAVGVDASLLSLSAEELHERRVQRSAALGVRSAVQMQRDALAVEQRRRQLEGSNVRGRISSLLGKMRQAPPQPPTRDTESASTGASAAADADGACVTSSTCSSSSGNRDDNGTSSAASASLVFRPSSLAAGGYVLTRHTVDGGGGSSSATRRALLGKPSSTLLLRYVHHSPLPALLAACQTAVAEHTHRHRPQDVNDSNSNSNSNNNVDCGSHAALAATLFDELLAPLLDAVRVECARHGVVRAVRAYVLSDEEVQRVTERIVASSADVARAATTTTTTTASGDAVAERVLRERLRLFVRFDTVAAAFKAAEEMSKTVRQWCIAFTPTASFDAGVLAPSSDEPLCSKAD